MEKYIGRYELLILLRGYIPIIIDIRVEGGQMVGLIERVSEGIISPVMHRRVEIINVTVYRGWTFFFFYSMVKSVPISESLDPHTRKKEPSHLLNYHHTFIPMLYFVFCLFD